MSEISGCAQVSFNPAGTVLVVTERTARTGGQAAGEGEHVRIAVPDPLRHEPCRGPHGTHHDHVDDRAE